MLVIILNARERIELVIWRRRGQCPFQRRRAFTPIIITNTFTVKHERFEKHDEEESNACERNPRAR